MYVTANFITKAVKNDLLPPALIFNNTLLTILNCGFFSALKHQFITFAMKGLGSLTFIKLNSILQKYPKPMGQSFPYIVKMTGEEAQVYMRKVLDG